MVPDYIGANASFILYEASIGGDFNVFGKSIDIEIEGSVGTGIGSSIEFLDKGVSISTGLVVFNGSITIGFN